MIVLCMHTCVGVESLLHSFHPDGHGCSSLRTKSGLTETEAGVMRRVSTATGGHSICSCYSRCYIHQHVAASIYNVRHAHRCASLRMPLSCMLPVTGLVLWERQVPLQLTVLLPWELWAGRTTRACLHTACQAAATPTVTAASACGRPLIAIALHAEQGRAQPCLPPPQRPHMR